MQRAQTERVLQPLFHAALSGEPEVCRALIEHGADPLVLDAMGYNCANYAKGMLVRQLLKNEQTRIEKKQECLELLAKADAKLEEYRSWLLRVEAEETRESSIRDKVSQASGLGERKERKALPTGQPASAAHGQNARAPAATPPLTHGRLLRHRFLRGLTRGLRAARGRREGIGQRGRCGALPPRGDSCGGCAGGPSVQGDLRIACGGVARLPLGAGDEGSGTRGRGDEGRVTAWARPADLPRADGVGRGCEHGGRRGAGGATGAGGGGAGGVRAGAELRAAGGGGDARTGGAPRVARGLHH